MTENEILEFQRAIHHTDWFGKPLKADGIIGPVTQWAMDMATLKNWRQSVVRLSLTEHAKGIVEIPPGSNRGLEIDKYIIWCNLDPKAKKGEGFRWCAASASYALSAGSPKPIRHASVKNLSKILIPALHPQPGDLAYSLRPDGTGHCGILIGIDEIDAMINEGNSNNRMEVVRRLRANLQFGTIVQGLPSMVPDIPIRLPGVNKSLKLIGTSSRTI